MFFFFGSRFCVLLFLHLGPMGYGPKGPWAHGPMGPRVHGPRAQGPWALGPRSGKLKIPKSTSASEKTKKTWTFRIARIDPSRQGVMTQAIFVHGDMRFWPKNEEKCQKGLPNHKTSDSPPPLSTAYFSFKGTNSPSLVPLQRGLYGRRSNPWCARRCLLSSMRAWYLLPL